MSRKRKITSEVKERAEPLHNAIAHFGKQRNSRSNFQNASADILIEVFLQAISTKNYSQGDDDDAVDIIHFKSQFTRQGWAKMAPVNVSAVCQHWRAVALSSPSLWSTFVGYGKRTYKRNVTSFPWEYLDVFLLRSKNAPFNLIIDLGYEPGMGYDRLLVAFYNTLSRLKTVDISWQTLSASSKAWHIELANMPLLETFRLDLWSDFCEGSYARIHIHLADAPVLHYLSLAGDFVLHHDGHLAFQNLTCVSLSRQTDMSWPEVNTGAAVKGISWHDCLMIMQASPSIEVFSAKGITDHRYRGVMFSDDIQLQVHTTVLSKLSSLYLEFEHNDRCLQRLLDKLYLPGLTEISLKAKMGANPPCGLQALLSRSEPIIRKLEVHGLDDEEVIECLEHMPALQTLSISSSTLLGSESISCLTLTQNTRVCPKLEDIQFCDCGDPSHYAEELSEMICSRWYNSMGEDERCFKSVTFKDCSGTMGYPYSDQLLEACREGLIIRNGSHVIHPGDYRDADRGASDDEWHGSSGSGYPSELEEYWAYNTSD